MITKKEAREIAIEYLKLKKRKFIKIIEEEKINLEANSKILYGKRAGELTDMYAVKYVVEWGLDFMGLYVQIAADTGEVLYTMTPTAIVEDFED